MLYNNH